MAEQFLRVPEVARRIGLNEAVTRAKMRRGEIPGARRLGESPRGALVILETDLEAWMRDRPLISHARAGPA